MVETRVSTCPDTCLGLNIQVGLSFKRGYFVFMAAGYAVGLLMANMAVYVMSMGQVSVKNNGCCGIHDASGDLRHLQHMNERQF